MTVPHGPRIGVSWLSAEEAAAHACVRPVRDDSRHHQGLRAAQLAPGLRVTAVAADGVVEGLEAADGRFVVGVQFHPEIAGEVPEAAPLFELLVSRAGDR